MSFRNGEAIVMHDVNDHIPGNTETRCGLKARAELYMRKYYKQIITVVFLLCAIIIFIVLVNRHVPKHMIPDDHHQAPGGDNGALEERMHDRFP